MGNAWRGGRVTPGSAPGPACYDLGGMLPTVTDADLLSGRCWTVPVLHNGRLYVRNMTRIACFDLRG